MATQDKPVNPERIQQLGWGYAPPLMLEAGVRLRVFDALDAGPKTAAQVAAETGSSPRGVGMLLNALVRLELLTKKGAAYALAPAAAAFPVPTDPGFLRRLLRPLRNPPV